MPRRFHRSALSTLLLLAALALPAAAQERAAGQPAARRSAPVEVAQARAASTTQDIRTIGTLLADESVAIAAEVAGRVSAIAFREGEPVTAGATLVQLDEALARAELVDVEARLSLAEANNTRAERLSRTGNVTERAQDEAVANFETARAAVELAKVRLAKQTLTAPFAGTVGFRAVSVGAYVTPGTAIVNLEKIDVVKLDFRLPEIVLAQVSVGQGIEVTVDAFPDSAFTGEIYAIDPQLDVNGRALRVRARLANADGRLRPGLFARVVVKGKSAQPVVLIPEAAIMPRGEDKVVFRVRDGKAFETKVTIAGRSAGEVAIASGLAANDSVVVAGQARLADGAAVEAVIARSGS